MEYFGVFAFIMWVAYSSYPNKVKRLEGKIRKLEKKIKGESVMSRLINEMIGKECNIKSEDAFELLGTDTMKCLILDVDDEWIKVKYTDKKGKEIIKIVRVENVDEIEVVSE